MASRRSVIGVAAVDSETELEQGVTRRERRPGTGEALLHSVRVNFEDERKVLGVDVVDRHETTDLLLLRGKACESIDDEHRFFGPALLCGVSKRVQHCDCVPAAHCERPVIGRPRLSTELTK